MKTDRRRMEEVRKKWRKRVRNEEVIVCGFLMYEEKRPSRSVTRSVGQSSTILDAVDIR